MYTIISYFLKNKMENKPGLESDIFGDAIRGFPIEKAGPAPMETKEIKIDAVRLNEKKAVGFGNFEEALGLKKEPDQTDKNKIIKMDDYKPKL